MRDVEEIFDKLIKPIPLEIKLEVSNRSVFGGFDQYILKWSAKLKNVSNQAKIKENAQELYLLFTDYNKREEAEKYKILEQAIDLSNNLAQEIRGRPVF